MKKCLVTVIFLTVFCLLGFANEESIRVSIESYKVWDSRLATETYEELDKVFPGDEILYVLTYENVSEFTIEGLQMTALIPEGTFYIRKSATGEKRDHLDWESQDVELYFSYDGGDTFEKPPLFVEEVIGGMVVKRLVNPKDYTNIMWIYENKFEPSDILKVLYRVKVPN
ncbi:MAG: hypothetical protein ACP5D6_09360 [Kosmotogaceae bacterium]